MKRRAMSQAIKHESDKRNKDLLEENDLSAGSLGDSKNGFRETRISVGQTSIYKPVMDNLQSTRTKSVNIDDYDFRKLQSREFGPRAHDGQSLTIRGLVADDSRNPTARVSTIGERDFVKMRDGEEESSREVSVLGKCGGSVNFSESRNREEIARDRSRGVAHPENTFDYTPAAAAAFPAIHSSRIPEESQFSRRTEKNAFRSDGVNALLDNVSSPRAIEFFTRSGISSRNNTDKDINCDTASSTIKSSSFEEFALLSKIVMPEVPSSMGGKGRPCGFGASEDIPGNVNALRNVSAVRKNLSAAVEIRDGSTGEGGRKTGNANVSTRISTAPALTRLQNLTSAVGITRPEELSAPGARPGDKSSTKIPESKTRGSLAANETRRGFPGDLAGDLGSKGRESRRGSPEREPKDMNLKNSYKFWKTRRKLPKSKDAEKFRGDKDVGGKLKRFGKLSRGLTRKRASPDFKRDSLPNGFSGREGRFRRHLQIGREVFNIADGHERGNSLTDEEPQQARALVDRYARPEAHSKRKTSNMAGDKNSPKKQVILDSARSHRKVQPEENDNPFYLNNEDGKKNSVDKRIEDKFARISNVLKEDSTETGIIQETPGNFKVVTNSEVAKADIPKIQDELKDNLFSRENGKSDETFAIHGDEVARKRPAEIMDLRSSANENSFVTTKPTNEEVTTIMLLTTRKDSLDRKNFTFHKSAIGCFRSSPVMKKLDYNVSKEMNRNESKNPIYATEFAARQTEVITRKLPSNSKNAHGYVTDDPLETLSGRSASSSKEPTSPEAPDNRSERDETKNARFLELNNNSSRMIAGNSVEPEGPPIDPGLSSRSSGSVTEPGEVSLSNEEAEIDSRYTGDPRLENSDGLSDKSREREEIGELVDRIVRQYVAYTPVMPGMPTFDEITEAETLPLEEETTVTQFTTTLATTTRITDVNFRPTIRSPGTTPLPAGEMHDEISLDETNLADEIEATTASPETTISKPRFRMGKPRTYSSSEAEAREVSNKTEKPGKKQKIYARVTGMKRTDAGEEVDDHPWYRTTEVQQVIAANRSKPVQKTKRERKKHKSETNYFQNTSSVWTSSTTATAGVARTRGKRSDFIRAAGNRDPPVFHDYCEREEDEEARRSGRPSLNKNEKSPNITEATELRSRIEKRLAGELDYPASRGFSPHSCCANRDQAQKINAALQDIVSRNAEVQDNPDSNVQEKERDVQGNLQSFSPLNLEDSAVRKFLDEDISSRNREAASAPFAASPSAKIPSSHTDVSGSVRESLEMDRRSEKRMAYGERTIAEIDRIATVRRVAVNVSRGKSSAGETSPARARSPGRRDETDETVIRGVKLMMPGDKGETRGPDVAAKSADKKISPPFPAPPARQRGRGDAARKINENPADRRRVSVAGKQYPRRPRGKVYDKVYDTVRKIINKIKGKSSSPVSDEADTEMGGRVRSEKRVDRSSDWHRSGRRLLSSRGGSGHIESPDDEYYASDESETDRENDSGDNEAIASGDDLSYLENSSGRREDRDPRKLVAETDRLTDGSVDVARIVMPEEKTVAAAMLSDDMANGEETISSSNYRKIEEKIKNTDSQDISVLETTDLTNFNDDKMLKDSLETEEKSITQSIVDNDASLQERSFDNSENIVRNPRYYVEVNEQPLSFPEKINGNNLQDESLYGTQLTHDNTGEIINFAAMNNPKLLSAERMVSNIDLSRSSTTPKSEEGIKISLIGRIQVHGNFNQTPMLISIDAIPDEFSATQSSVPAELLNTIKAIEATTINLPLNDSNVDSTFDVLSISERANDEASDSLNTVLDESREVGRMNEVTTKSCEKFVDPMRRSGGEGKTTKKNLSRIKKRLDRYNTNSKSAKQVFLTDYSIVPNSKGDRTKDVERMIFERTDGTIDKLDTRTSASPVYFPDILGSVLINNDSLKDQHAIKEPEIDIPPPIETNRFDSIEIHPSNATLHIVPLVHINIEKPSVDLTNESGKTTETTCCPRENPRNATSGGCYRMPATVWKLETTGTTSHELQTSSNYRDGDPTETLPRFYETTVNDRDAVTVSSLSSTRLQNVPERTTYETRSTSTPPSKCNDESVNVIRVRNMMAIVRFLLKLLGVIAEGEEPPCPGTRIGETMIHVKNVIINASSHVGRHKSITNTDDRGTAIKSGGTGQDLTTTATEWRSTITERIREKSSPPGAFESFTEAPSYPATSTLATSFDEVAKDEGPATFFETATGREVYATSTSSSTTSSATPKSFLFYEPARKSPRKGASRKNISPDLTGVKRNSSVAFKGSEGEESGERKFRLDNSQTPRSSSWVQDRNSVGRLRYGKQGIAAATNAADKIGASREKYLAMGDTVDFRRSQSTGVANGAVRPTLPRDVAPRNAPFEGIDAGRGNRPERAAKPSRRVRRTGVSDRRAETRTKLLNRSARGGPPGDWIGEHWSAATRRRLPIDKKLRESRGKVPGGNATPGKVVFRRVRGKINRPPDPNLVSGGSDSFKIENNVGGSGPLAKLSTNDALFAIGGGLSSLESEDTTGSAIRYSSSVSLMSDNVATSGIDKEVADERKSIPNKKRDVSERRGLWEGNGVPRKRQKASGPAKSETKRRRKKKRKKGGQQTKDTPETENQRRFKRRLLMTSLESEYDADDVPARFSRRHVATAGRNAEERRFRTFARSNARGRRRERGDGSRMEVDGTEADPGTAQIRGGQDCTDRRRPPNIDAAKYLESAHCLRFSDLWYSVYQLEDPIVEHVVYLQVYEKRALANGSTYWEDLTRDSVVRLGTFNRHHRDSQDTIAFAYKEVKMLERGMNEMPNLNVVRDRLLVPSSVTSKNSEYSAEGSRKLLVRA
ncbi:uncharacterized protein LOC118646540 [Monomorium pharaonis]|uniref:uncharacterized protein LOC118646540 n=1 Tax=Monomorium pharaonis TaxID=307658 RepID=UPI0017463D98|nr:uncharacterized protein LOC118646540 [Monomorium pharaonis]